MTAALLVFSASASAAGTATDEWLPHPADAQWQYAWTDSVYSPVATVENVTVAEQSGTGFTLAWAATGGPSAPAPYSLPCAATAAGVPDVGNVSFEDTSYGLTNTNWSACPPPADMPVLCSSPDNCPNSLASTFFNVIWGTRTPVLSEPLLQGTAWSGQGGAGTPLATSSSAYLGVQRVTVPAFPQGVQAAVVKSDITQAGALGDPYGSGTRTTWWVYGVGPVKVIFDHSGGASAPVTSAELLSTNQSPQHAPADSNYFPLRVGMTGTYRWTNSKPSFPGPEIEKISVDATANDTAALSVKSVSGPIKVLSSKYLFTLRLDTGLTNTYGSTSARSIVNFPPLGHHRHFLTPIDLMTFGFNPVLPAYPSDGASWHSGSALDFSVYGVRGTTKIIGIRTVRVPAGKFRALEVRSVLTQRGHAFGSGVRTCWFAAGRGLVKLVFQHRGGGVSLVQLLK